MPGSENSKVIMYYVYVLESIKHGDSYIGYTNDLRRRLKEHNQGLNKSTKPYLPWRLIYYEACLNEIDTQRRENTLKPHKVVGYLKED